jgi:hypothetical protein
MTTRCMFAAFVVVFSARCFAATDTIIPLPKDIRAMYDSLIVVIPSLDIVVARAGQSWKRENGADHYDVLKPFLGPIVQSVQRQETSDRNDQDWLAYGRSARC